MTMVAEHRLRHCRRRRGQSIIEFVILVPLLAGMVYLLLGFEMAVSTAIVNARYARQHLHYLFFNHSYLLEGQKWAKKSSGGYRGSYWIGVSDVLNNDSPDGHIQAVAPVRAISIKPFKRRSDADQQRITDSPDGRQNIRVRSLAFTCLPPTGVNNSGWMTEGYMREDQFTAGGGSKYCVDN